MRTRRLAIALLVLCSGASAAELGTLFYTPKERAELERLRRGEPTEQAGSGPAIVTPDPVVTGYVKRSDGKSTVFIDKRPYPARSERVQGLLEPRIIERYEPIPLPPEPAPEAGKVAAPAAPGTPGPASPARPKGGREE